MAHAESKRQKRLAKQKAKRSQKRQEIKRASTMSLAQQLARFESAPVIDCLVNSSFEKQGLANLLLGRKAPTGEFVFACFLVDPYCLGVKDAFAKIMTPGEYRERLEHFREMGVRSIDAPSLKRLIEDSLAYAKSLGLAPHPDFARVRPILNGIDSSQALETFEMGKDGKPYFVAGPSQSAMDCRRIISILQKNCGRDEFHFTVPFGGIEMDEEDFD